ncbi:MAG TPA: cob(I)yrinic acid a,c-diamide adenosyltransferase [Chitinophagales bacterium]|nr:cob(I)yrinic acid a,c-diamide adenosyltransferase [Chitinophagales bacterium]
MKIYTKKGDAGETSLFGGSRVSKSDLRIESYGTVDELNSWLGFVRDSADDRHTRDVLKIVQDRLFTIGALLAADPKKPKLKIPALKEDDVTLLEKEIDRMEESLQPLKAFILPGGHPDVSRIHIARCVCRRAERWVVALGKKEKIETLIIKYLNRLSDYLFVLARWTAKNLNVKEIPWDAADG